MSWTHRESTPRGASTQTMPRATHTYAHTSTQTMPHATHTYADLEAQEERELGCYRVLPREEEALDAKRPHELGLHWPENLHQVCSCTYVHT